MNAQTWRRVRRTPRCHPAGPHTGDGTSPGSAGTPPSTNRTKKENIVTTTIRTIGFTRTGRPIYQIAGGSDGGDGGEGGDGGAPAITATPTADTGGNRDTSMQQVNAAAEDRFAELRQQWVAPLSRARKAFPEVDAAAKPVSAGAQPIMIEAIEREINAIREDRDLHDDVKRRQIREVIDTARRDIDTKFRAARQAQPQLRAALAEAAVPTLPSSTQGQMRTLNATNALQAALSAATATGQDPAMTLRDLVAEGGDIAAVAGSATGRNIMLGAGLNDQQISLVFDAVVEASRRGLAAENAKQHMEAATALAQMSTLETYTGAHTDALRNRLDNLR